MEFVSGSLVCTAVIYMKCTWY